MLCSTLHGVMRTRHFFFSFAPPILNIMHRHTVKVEDIIALIKGHVQIGEIFLGKGIIP
jgi:hypothetical protein